MEEKDVYATVRDRLRDPLWRLNHLYYILGKQGACQRFNLNCAQLDLFEKRHSLNLVLKARQLGITTFIQLYMLDAALFKKGIRCGIIAHNLKDAQVFFRDKIQYAYERLPAVIKEYCSPIRWNANEVIFSNNSSIRIGTSMRSGTLQMLHVSEFGKIACKYPEKASEILSGALNAVAPGCEVFIESTAEGKEGLFYELVDKASSKQRQGLPLSQMDFKLFFYPWWFEKGYTLESQEAAWQIEDERYFNFLESDYGIKLSEGQKFWYSKKNELHGMEMKQEYPSIPEEAFSYSLEGTYFAKPINLLEDAGQITTVPYNKTYLVDTWWDLGLDDAMSIWFTQSLPGGRFNIIEYYEWSDEGLPYYISYLKERGYIYGRHYAPHDIRVRELSSGNSRYDIAKQLGLEFCVIPRSSVLDGIEAIRNILPRCYFDVKKCEKGILALRQYRKEWNTKMGCYKQGPLHDWTSHAADSFRGFAMQYEEYKLQKKRDSSQSKVRGIWV